MVQKVPHFYTFLRQELHISKKKNLENLWSNKSALRKALPFQFNFILSYAMLIFMPWKLTLNFMSFSKSALFINPFYSTGLLYLMKSIENQWHEMG